MNKNILWVYISLIFFATCCKDQGWIVYEPDSSESEEVVVSIPESIKWRVIDSNPIVESRMEGKHLFLYVYDPDCEPCKIMSATTLKDEKVVKELNANFWCIKEDINSLPVGILLMMEATPSVVVFKLNDDSESGIIVVSGLQSPEELLRVLDQAQQ